MNALMEPKANHVHSVAAPRAEPKKAGKFSMTILNYWLDAALLLTAICIVWVTLMLHLVFPPATQADGCSLWGLTYDQWRNVQLGALCFFALLSVEHLVLHWNWICTVTASHILGARKPDAGVQAVLGVGTFITISVIVLATLIVAQVMAVIPTR